jgi:hypothetical protein
LKLSSADARVGSIDSVAVRVTPGPFRSTIASEIPEPERAATTANVATFPSGTPIFLPVSLPPASAVLMLCCDGKPGPSASARVPTALPFASAGSHFLRCWSLPASRIASVAR